MNTIWAFTFFVLPIIGLAYSLWHVWNILPLSPVVKTIIAVILALCFVVMITNFTVGLDRYPMMVSEVLYEVGNSSIFVMLYAVMLFLVLDLGRLMHIVPREWLYQSTKGSIAVFVFMTSLFTYAYWNYLQKERQPIVLQTAKAIERPLKIVMMTDLHLGYHNRKAEIRKWIELINAEHPDLVLIGGDIIDGSIRAIEEQNMAEDFRRIKAPIYACLGNHEYYSGEPRAQKFYHEAGIHLLKDEVVEVMGVNIIGRDDRTNKKRASVADLYKQVKDKNKYTILLDHQPYHLEEAEKSGIDFQLSGHTHYGQVWPISWIEDAMYEKAYGPLTKGKTQYFVSSGIGIWGAKFRIGTHSEYLVATLTKR